MSILGINASPQNVQPPVIVQEKESINLVFNIGGQTMSLGTSSNTLEPEGRDVTPHTKEDDAIELKPHVDHNERPLS
jgi:hypothetical protein